MVTPGGMRSGDDGSGTVRRYLWNGHSGSSPQQEDDLAIGAEVHYGDWLLTVTAVGDGSVRSDVDPT